MLVVLAIVLTMAALAYPSLQSVTHLTHATLLQAELMRAIQLAKLEVATHHHPVSLCKSNDLSHCGGDWSHGLLVFIDRDENGVVHASRDILAKVQLTANSGKLYWRAYPNYREYLRLLPTDWVSMDNGMFWYCHTGAQLPDFAIVISQGGVVRAKQPDKHGEIKDSRGRIMQCSASALRATARQASTP